MAGGSNYLLRKKHLSAQPQLTIRFSQDSIICVARRHAEFASSQKLHARPFVCACPMRYSVLG